MKDNIDFPIDGRGKHRNRPHTVPNSVRALIRSHIGSFPKQLSHYSRKKSEKECLSPVLSLSKMYRLFTELHPDVKASKILYNKVFVKDFNLHFGLPHLDTCKYCDSLYVKLISAESEEERRDIQTQSDLHHSKADQAYKTLKKDTLTAQRNKNIIILCVDLQQVLFCPNLTHSSVFYQRQLSNYNFAIHDMGTGEVTMCVWHECQAKRGSTEISSCILKYLLDRFSVLQSGEERKLVIWSDQCTGQNNNWRMLNLYGLLVQSRFFSEINKKCLCSGHSFLPCDRDFALIERKRKTANALVLVDWKYVIAEARLNKPFIVIEMQQKDFKNFKPVEKALVKNTNLKITGAMWLKMTSDDPSHVYVRSSHNILRPGVFSNFMEEKSTRLQCAICLSCTAIMSVSEEKRKDLVDMCEYLAPDKKAFYQNLLNF